MYGRKTINQHIEMKTKLLLLLLLTGCATSKHQTRTSRDVLDDYTHQYIRYLSTDDTAYLKQSKRTFNTYIKLKTYEINRSNQRSAR
jgi:hypothetical protein